MEKCAEIQSFTFEASLVSFLSVFAGPFFCFVFLWGFFVCLFFGLVGFGFFSPLPLLFMNRYFQFDF